MKKLKITAGILLVVLAFIIVLQNSEVMTTELLFWRITMSRSLALLVTYLLGLLTGLAAGFLLTKKGAKSRDAAGGASRADKPARTSIDRGSE